MTDDDFTALREKAEAGDPTSQAALGIRYLTGNGLPRDLSEALRWCELAAAQGEPSACINLGSLHLTGDAGDRNPDVALGWYQKAALTATAEQLLHIARIVETEEAFRGAAAVEFFLHCYQRAVALKTRDAEFSLGSRYYFGVNLPEERDTGIRYLKRAAMAGHPNALFFFAQGYASGQFGDPDIAYATFLYYFAALEGSERGEAEGRLLEAQLSPDERMRVEARAKSTYQVLLKDGREVAYRDIIRC